jgi:hypothetical protein
MTIREDVTTREPANTGAANAAIGFAAMPALRALPVLADLRTHPVLHTLPAKAVATVRESHARIRSTVRNWLARLPTMEAIMRSARREALCFLRDNGFAPLAGLFVLSPRLAWAMMLPFALTCLFGIFIFGVELVLVCALGLFFAMLVANDAARRLQEEARARKPRGIAVSDMTAIDTVAIDMSAIDIAAPETAARGIEVMGDETGSALRGHEIRKEV